MKLMTRWPFQQWFLSDVREKRPALSSGFQSCVSQTQLYECVYGFEFECECECEYEYEYEYDEYVYEYEYVFENAPVSTHIHICFFFRLIKKEAHLVFRGTSSCFQRTSGKPRWWENIDTLQRETYNCRVIVAHHCLCQSTQDLRSHRGLVPGTCSASRSSFSTKHRDFCCEGAMISHQKFPSEDVSSLTEGPLWSLRFRGNFVRQQEEKFGSLPEYFLLTKACDDASFMRNASQGQGQGNLLRSNREQDSLKRFHLRRGPFLRSC